MVATDMEENMTNKPYDVGPSCDGKWTWKHWLAFPFMLVLTLLVMFGLWMAGPAETDPEDRG